jgi:hypothetical protein
VFLLHHPPTVSFGLTFVSHISVARSVVCVLVISMSFWDTVMDSPGEESNDRILVPVQVDKIAQTNPDRAAFSFPRTTNVADGFQDLTFRTVRGCFPRD